MARRGQPMNFINASFESSKECAKDQARIDKKTGTEGENRMPLTQENRVDSHFANNNDHSYLHKKFKKMASTMSVPSPETSQTNSKEPEKGSDTLKCNGYMISHPENKTRPDLNYQNDKVSLDLTKNVQTTFTNDNLNRLSDLNQTDHAPGKTSFSEEFSHKTENVDSDFNKEIQNCSSGRYVCPYCKLACAKPSVLQKHIRAHTNERPYPCVPCGFAFKTKSNLYKHRRSRTHALRLQGQDVPLNNDEEMSPGSESDTSLPPTSVSDAGSDISVVRLENNSHPSEFSSPELTSDRISPNYINVGSSEGAKSKTIYKPKFRAAFYRENDEKDKRKPFSPNADFLNEHISKIISDNEAIVDDIETPLQKKYSKIKQIAESQQMQSCENLDIKLDSSPLNLTKTVKDENCFRKRAHSETFTQIDFQKHPLNPEGSIIKDLLLKTKGNGLVSITEEVEGVGTLYICPLCQITYRSAENLDIHRMYYCKGNMTAHKDAKRHENVFMRSNSINVRLPESTQSNMSRISVKSPSPRSSKPDNLVIIKPECSDVVAPLPSPGPLLGNTRLVDTRMDSYQSKPEKKKALSFDGPKRRIEGRPDSYSPRLSENISPRQDTYLHPKLRCVDPSFVALRAFDDLHNSNVRNNSASLQMFGGEVKIVDHSGSTTTLRIEPSKNQLSPILVHQNGLSNLAAEAEASSVVVRSGLHSGGTIVHTPKELKTATKPQTPRITISAAPDLHNMTPIHDITHFKFPPLSAITAFNPLTLPPLSPNTPNGTTSIMHGGKIIPHVPGIPGPNSSTLFVGTPDSQNKNDVKSINIEISECKQDNLLGYSSKLSANRLENARSSKSPNNRIIKPDVEKQNCVPVIGHLERRPPSMHSPVLKVKTFDKPIARADNIPLKRSADGSPKPHFLKDTPTENAVRNKFAERQPHPLSKSLELKTPKEQNIRHFNFENLITKAEIFNNQIPSSSDVQKNSSQELLMIAQNERSETSYFQKNSNVKTSQEDRKPKFLRPSTLPLKPGTFTPKRHHGITPNANTMPLVSPETPRPAKAYGQLYLNGNAYTYLGLKCSTKVFYCTINRPQPTYVPNQHFLSMYSNWQLLSDLTPDPLGLSASSAMSLYDSRHRPQNVVTSKIKQDFILTHSSQWNKNAKDSKQALPTLESLKGDDNKLSSIDSVTGLKKELAGGFESNEEYTYIRGRGRGRYVCSECGIRCKKPSMLKKHIRTHTDVRPYTCTHCAFSFKTKGNLTKHMKSKAHYKKCCELGINPNEGTDMEGGDVAQCSGETDDESDSDGDDGNEGETESSDTEVGRSRLPEHEAAHCLLSLGCSRRSTSANPGLITSARPTTYPYSPVATDIVTTSEQTQESRSLVRTTSAIDSGVDMDNQPMDLSKNDVKSPLTILEIPTARESSVLASLASNTAKLPQQQATWSNGEPMLHAYLTERALLDSKIKQSQLTSSLSKMRKMEYDEAVNESKTEVDNITIKTDIDAPIAQSFSQHNVFTSQASVESTSALQQTKNEVSTSKSISNNNIMDVKKNRSESNAENAKHVVSEYLKLAKVNCNENTQQQNETVQEGKPLVSNGKITLSNLEDASNAESEGKLSIVDHDTVAHKVVIGAGGVTFKVTKGKEFDNSSSYSGRLMEDGRRVCDFCNKSFTKPSQLKLHLNIHYMERPFRCSACAVSFRTRGHLQKHERSGSHHNKVSMTSTFGAATSLNPRPFRCSDCNIAFRIHGHLAKHLRSKMHVMRLECLFKLPFGTFTEIERAGVSLTDIDTTDCASSLASLQLLARKLHEKDPTKLEFRDAPAGSDRSDDEDAPDKACDSEADSDARTTDKCESQNLETRAIFSATDN